jgi:DNA replication protein DnaC
MNAALTDALRRLRLSGLARTLDVRLQEAAGHQLSHADFLELIFADELAIRGERLIARRVQAAAFRDLKTLDDFDWRFNPSVPRKTIYDLATCQFIRERRDVLLVGPPDVVTYCNTSLSA